MSNPARPSGRLVHVTSALVRATRRPNPAGADRLNRWRGHQVFLDVHCIVVHVAAYCSTCGGNA